MKGTTVYGLSELEELDVESLTPSENADLCIELEERLRETNALAERAGWRERSRRFWRALVLAPTIEVCEELLSGRKVAIASLDDEAVRRLPRQVR